MAVDDVQAAPQADQPGTPLPRAFGKYLLLERIGRGGMAEIFLAQVATELGAARRVVVKEILPEYSRDPSFVRALVAEAKLAAQLSHNNLVRVLDLGREAGRLFIAMEYVEGFDLNQLLGKLSRRRIPLPAEFALFVVREVLVALDYAHRAVDAHGTPLGVVHRDVSPSNVLISLEGEVRLCDFGIARAFAPDALAFDPADLEAEHAPAGKHAYMAPEHARGGDVDARSDVFAVGILLWELCAGHRLYKGSDPTTLDLSHLVEIPPLPARGLPEAERLDALLRRALAFDPALRFQSAKEMLVELENYALSTHLMASQLRFAAFLGHYFGDSFAALRRERERVAERALRPSAAAPLTGNVSESAVFASAPAVRRSGVFAHAPGPAPAWASDPEDTEPSRPLRARPALAHVLGLAGAVVLGLALLVWLIAR
jgi:serine/threonine protein kinase